MVAVTTELSVTELAPLGGSTLDGLKFGLISAGAKASANDKWKIMNVKTVVKAFITQDNTGIAEKHTISGQEITLTGTTGTPCSGLVFYK